MKFDFVPDEARVAAVVTAEHFKSRGFTVRSDRSPWPDSHYRPTLVAQKSGLTVIVEAQGSLTYGRLLKELAVWLAARRHYAEFYISIMSDTTYHAGTLSEMRKDGVGLFTVNDNRQLMEELKAKNHALVVTPDPTLNYRSCKAEVKAALDKFNDVNRKDGLRDMCELVERETDKLAVRAAIRGRIVKTQAQIKTMSWSDQINMLAACTSYNAGHAPLVTSTLKDDLHSFRNARNLVDHKVSGVREDQNRQRQYAERMTQGPRLVAELAALRAKIH
jgi:hypothetical protein